MPTLTDVVTAIKAKATPGQAFGLPPNAVRATMTMLLIGGMLWMQWWSPKEGAVPPSLISAAGLATGFYLTGDSSPTMKALISLLYVIAFVAFLVEYNWLPESINSQVTIVLGVYFGNRMRSTPPATTP